MDLNRRIIPQREKLEKVIAMCDSKERCLTAFYLINGCFQSSSISNKELQELTGILSVKWGAIIKSSTLEKEEVA